MPTLHQLLEDVKGVREVTGVQYQKIHKQREIEARGGIVDNPIDPFGSLGGLLRALNTLIDKYETELKK